MEEIRKLDNLNRLCLPIQMRAVLGVTTGSRLRATVRGGAIHLKKASDDDVITWTIDGVGRVLIPQDMLASLGAGEYASIHLSCAGGELILRLALPCGDENDLWEYEEASYVCSHRLETLKKL